jgi:hypothetical protein
MPQETSLAAGVLPLFVRWYVVKQPKAIVRMTVAYMETTEEIFSIVFLLKTLFSPWKNIVDRYPKKGINIEAMMESFFLNLTTRLLGAMIRILTIILGCVVECIVLFAGFSWLILWYAYPIVLLISIANLFRS